jgi:hypothetical protein
MSSSEPGSSPTNWLMYTSRCVGRDRSEMSPSLLALVAWAGLEMLLQLHAHVAGPFCNTCVPWQKSEDMSSEEMCR